MGNVFLKNNVPKAPDNSAVFSRKHDPMQSS